MVFVVCEEQACVPKQKKLSQHYVREYARNHDPEFRKLCGGNNKGPKLNVNGRWTPPELGWFKLNTDAGCRGGVST